MMLVLSPFSGRAADRFGLRHQPTVGLLLVCAGLAVLATVGPNTSTPLIVARLALVGTGAAIFQSPNSAAIMSSVPRAMLGTASAAVATSRNIGNAAGLALASTLLVTVAGTAAGVSASRVEIPPAQLLDGVRTAFAVAAVCSSFAVAASLFRPRRALLATETVEVGAEAPVSR
jgi:MFS family permease